MTKSATLKAPLDSPPTGCLLSVIVPCRNDAAALDALLRELTARTTAGDRPPDEIIVVDGGSNDATIAVATTAGVRCIKAPAGRGRQLRAGAVSARGNVLMFLHADCLPPRGFVNAACRTLADPDVAAGAFTLHIDGDGEGLRRIERGVARRSEEKQMPYGDQGLFLRKQTYVAAGGYPDLPAMEDYAFVRTLRRHGRIVTLRDTIRSSDRAWRKRGVVWNTVLNQLCIASYRVGVSPHLIARWRGIHSREPSHAQRN